MKILSVSGQIDFTALYGELRTALGDAGIPQRWYFNGAQGEVTAYFADDISAVTVQNVLDAHVSQAGVDARAAAAAALVVRRSADSTELGDFIADATIAALINQTKAQWVSWAGTNFPTLTVAERTRLGTLFWVVAIGVRRLMR